MYCTADHDKSGEDVDIHAGSIAGRPALREDSVQKPALQTFGVLRNELPLPSLSSEFDSMLHRTSRGYGVLRTSTLVTER